MKHNTIIALCLMALALAFSPLAPAQATEVAVVNIQKIMKESKAANAIRSQVQAKQKDFQAELDKKEKSLQQEDQELAKQRNVLSQEAFKEKYTAFRTKAMEAQQEVRAKRAKLEKGLAKALESIQSKVTEIVAGVSKEKGFDVAVSGNLVLYTAEKNDITAEVLSRLNSQLPNINVTFE